LTIGLAGEVGLDEWFVAPGTDHLDELRLLSRCLGRQDGNDLDAVDQELGLSSEDVADCSAGREDGTVEFTLGLLGPGGTPGPHVTPVALRRQFDLETGGHARTLPKP